MLKVVLSGNFGGVGDVLHLDSGDMELTLELKKANDIVPFIGGYLTLKKIIAMRDFLNKIVNDDA